MSWQALKAKSPVILKSFCPKCGEVGIQESNNRITGEQGTFHCFNGKCGWSGKIDHDAAALLDPSTGDILDRRNLISPGKVPPSMEDRFAAQGDVMGGIMPGGGGYVVDDVPCPHCDSRNVMFLGMAQDKSSDEPESRMYRCQETDHKPNQAYTFREQG